MLEGTIRSGGAKGLGGELPGHVHYGITPHIGSNGNWFVGNTDTGKPSRGTDGQDYILTAADKAEIAEMAANLVEVPDPGGDADFKTNKTLIMKDGVLSVNTTDQMEQDNTLPITSASVYATVGNIEALLKTI